MIRTTTTKISHLIQIVIGIWRNQHLAPQNSTSFFPLQFRTTTIKPSFSWIGPTYQYTLIDALRTYFLDATASRYWYWSGMSYHFASDPFNASLDAWLQSRKIVCMYAGTKRQPPVLLSLQLSNIFTTKVVTKHLLYVYTTALVKRLMHFTACCFLFCFSFLFSLWASPRSSMAQSTIHRRKGDTFT
jgi:hypothetical protein